MKKFINYLKSLRLGGYCGYCEKFHLLMRHRRQNTQYVDEEKNWVTCCRQQFEEIQSYWKERWDDYYSTRF